MKKPFGWVALYCGQKIFTDNKAVADFYATCCKVIPLFAPQEKQHGG